MQQAIECAESAVLKQTACSAKIDSALQRIIRAAEVAKSRLESVADSPENVLSSVEKAIQEDLKATVGYTKDIHSAIGKLGKVRLGHNHQPWQLHYFTSAQSFMVEKS